jgi:hypothetical protein
VEGHDARHLVARETVLEKGPDFVGSNIAARQYLDGSRQGLTVIVVGNPEDRAIRDAGEQGQRVLDLGPRYRGGGPARARSRLDRC